jgi:hypothetical protein
MLLVLVNPAKADGLSREATVTGLGGNGTCTVEVNVDGVAEVEISGNMGYLTTISGQPAHWRRFQCNTPLPRDPADFQLARAAGRGFLRLVREPRGSGGRAVIRIDDPNPGRGVYTFDLQWRDPRGGTWPPMHHPPGWGRGSGGFPPTDSVVACQDSVTNRLRHDGYAFVTFDRTSGLFH